MNKNYEEVCILIRNIGYADWYPEVDNVILVQECGNYTFLPNRLDNLCLDTYNFISAIKISPISDELWKIEYLTKEQLKDF